QAILFLQQGRGYSEQDLPEIDGDHIYLAGYSLGGMVGLYTAALDDRVAGVASFCGFTPLRTDTDDKPTGGTRRLWEWHAIQPRLGLYHGREDAFPYDFDEVIGLVAPRPCLIVAPTRDREADADDVKACVEVAAKAWDEQDKLTFLAPDDVNRFQKAQQDMLLDWLGSLEE
ncbi:MAG: hypothetical protein GY851_16860, partial [bacterium]|nr:hypothetical protein [bacterium]